MSRRLSLWSLPQLVLIPFFALLVTVDYAYAEQTEWELGAGLGLLQLPHYPGASGSDTYLLPVPFVSLRTPYLDIDEGVRAKLFKSDRVKLNLSADIGVPVNSDESAVRQGMPDLDTVLQIGPMLELGVSGGRKQPYYLRFELPARLAFATDFESIDNLGWIIEPRLTYETRRPYKTGFSWLLSAGFKAASSEYHSYYYDVPASFATATRPQFRADDGYSGLFADIIGAWRFDGYILWTFLRYQNLGSAEFVDSPLVEQEDYYFYGAGITWVLAGSR